MDKSVVILSAGLLLSFYVSFGEAQRNNGCANRVRHATFRDPRGVNHNYFFSWEHGPTRTSEFEWGSAQSFCRRNCMQLVSLETPAENNFVKQRIARGRQRYIWTSGRRCAGCNSNDSWVWSGSGTRIGSARSRANGDWSHTGGFGRPQPDNREIAQGRDETCLAILNNFYNDGIKWHDVACHHLKPFVCEDA